MTTDFALDITRLRDNARKQIELGPITDAYGADVNRVIDVCNEALATELVCVLRYKRHYFTATGLDAPQVAAEFLQHASEEQGHADQLAHRITQLGGKPDFNPATLVERAHAEYDDSDDLLEMVREDLIAERIAIASYTEIIQWLGSSDPTSRRLFEGILEVEEEHADDLLGFLQNMKPKT
jgi:bacterioferritin